jgi:dUTP pyrophosphatase
MTYTVRVTPVSLRLTRLSPHAELPRYQTPHAAGLDLHAAIDQPIHLEAGQIVMIPCGFAMAIPDGFEAQIRPRSGLGSRGITLPNSPGTIDADYRGEVRVPLINHGPATFTIEPRMRIAQMVIAPVARAEIIEVDHLDETSRGAGGFGSTGS